MNDRPTNRSGPPNTDPLVELAVAGGAPTTSFGMRVLPTGEYQIAAPSRSGPAADWRTIWVYSEAELRAVRAAVDAADDPPLPAEITSSAPVRDGGTARWTLRTTKRLAVVTITGYPVARAGSLDRLSAELQRLHSWPKGGSVWRVDTGGATVVRTAKCDAMTLPSLEVVLSALYPDGQVDTPGPFQLDDLEPALIDVTWYADGRVVDRLRVFSDGRRHALHEGVLRDLPMFSAAALAALGRAIGSTPWRSLPEPLCESPG